MVQYKHTEDKQARRNERPLSGFVRGERILRKKEKNEKEKATEREREAGNSRPDHMTESIVILSEKGLEQSISPSGPSKKRETDRKTHPEMEREGERSAA